MTPARPQIPKPPFLASTLNHWLIQDGDLRLSLDPLSGRNRYGCLPYPEQLCSSFSSSTASTISPAAYACAQALHQKMENTGPLEQTAACDRLRRELSVFCGVADLDACGIILAASGTDVHLLAAQLSACGRPSTPPTRGPLRIVMTEGSETGNGVPTALKGRHYNGQAPLAGAVIPDDALTDRRQTELCVAWCRDAEGNLRPTSDLDAETQKLTIQAVDEGRRVLLIVSDVSKTGLLAPSPGCALNLLQRFPQSVDVLIDACQFRLSSETIRAYVDHGFLVALTGSKFVTGPAFSGVLLIPPSLSPAWSQRPLPASLAAYSARADWPRGWVGRESMDRAVNYGLILRWEAALTELKSFHALPQGEVAPFLRGFADAVQERLAKDASFEILKTGPLERRPVARGLNWDRERTLFPFLLKGREHPLDSNETNVIYRSLLENGRQLGQPARCGLRQGMEVSALRLCNSMRLAVDALSPAGRGANAVIAEALALLDQASRVTRERAKI